MILRNEQINSYKRKSCVDVTQAEMLIFNIQNKAKINNKKQYKEDYF